VSTPTVPTADRSRMAPPRGLTLSIVSPFPAHRTQALTSRRRPAGRAAVARPAARVPPDRGLPGRAYRPATPTTGLSVEADRWLPGRVNAT
ncbi:MAG: hypothetical protein JWQ60_155, partial [Pseudonocardia sp.]|nr:hypothetical protein [Pseudonocardia sp.]